MAAQHDHKEESNLGTGLLGFGIALVWLAVVIYASHMIALAAH